MESQCFSFLVGISQWAEVSSRPQSGLRDAIKRGRRSQREYLLAPFYYASVAPSGRPITCSVSLRKRRLCRPITRLRRRLKDMVNQPKHPNCWGLNIRENVYNVYRLQFFFCTPSLGSEEWMCTMCTDYSFFCVPHLLEGEEWNVYNVYRLQFFLCTPPLGKWGVKCIQCVQITVFFVLPYWRQRVRERIIMYNNILYNNIYNYI